MTMHSDCGYSRCQYQLIQSFLMDTSIHEVISGLLLNWYNYDRTCPLIGLAARMLMLRGY